jgi:hypothetical protein
MNILQKTAVATILSLSGGSAFASVISASLVDNGNYLHAFAANGVALRSQHFEGGNVGDRQFTLTGDQQGFIPGVGNFTSSRRGYFAFDLSGKTDTVTSAIFRVWGWAPNNGPEVSSGVYGSADASETLQLYSVDNHSVSQVVNAPYNDNSNHAVDVPIWEDLGSGTVYGSREFTAADGQAPGLIASPLSSTTDCSAPAPGDACGRWIDFELNAAALADINAATGDWVFGTAISTIDGGSQGTSEQLLSGAPVDLSNPAIPDFRQPAPQLFLTSVPVPAAVWLFGTALAGLVGVRGRKRNLAY